MIGDGYPFVTRDAKFGLGLVQLPLEGFHAPDREVVIATTEGGSRVHRACGVGVELNPHLLPVRNDEFVDETLVEEGRSELLPRNFAG